MTMCGLLSLVTLVVALAVGPSLAGTRPREVHINKCCRLGEFYSEADKRCQPGGIDKWVPQIYLPMKNVMFQDVGSSPPFMKFVEQQLPQSCAQPTVYASKTVTLMGNGSLFLNQKHLLVPIADYCVDERVALVCRVEVVTGGGKMDSLLAPEKTSVVWRCCGPNFVYDKANRTCTPLPRGHELYESRIVNSPYVELSYGFPACKEHAIAGVYDETRLQPQTGSVTTESGKIFASGEYCLEHVLDDDRTVYVFTCSEHFQPASVPIAKQDGRLVLYSAGLLISTIFLAATLATGLLVPSQHHVLHWRCQTHYVACLLVGDLLLAITQLSGTSITGPGCTMIAIMMHFFFLAAFFWLNTMCFNIWWTFRDLRPTSLEKSQEVCRLRIYEVYAWGVPLVIAGVAAILDNLPGGNDTYLKPRFGEARCWFFGDMEMLTYFFGPIGLLLGINLLLFASTARQLTCGLWKRDDVKSTTERAALGRVCLKLVVVMGVTWVADVVSWAVGGPKYIWIVTDLINALQGVFIFIVVGCQPQSPEYSSFQHHQSLVPARNRRKALKQHLLKLYGLALECRREREVWAAMKRLWNSKTGRSFTNTTHGPQHSSSSHGLPSMGESITNNTCTNNTTTTASNNKVPMETVC